MKHVGNITRGQKGESTPAFRAPQVIAATDKNVSSMIFSPLEGVEEKRPTTNQSIRHPLEMRSLSHILMNQDDVPTHTSFRYRLDNESLLEMERQTIGLMLPPAARTAPRVELSQQGSDTSLATSNLLRKSE
jgi:hypothetical protein